MALRHPRHARPAIQGDELDQDRKSISKRTKAKNRSCLMFSSTRVDPAQIGQVRDLWKKYREKSEIITISYKLPSVSMAKAFMQQMGAKFPATYDPGAKHSTNRTASRIRSASSSSTSTGTSPTPAEALDAKDTKTLEDAITANSHS